MFSTSGEVDHQSEIPRISGIPISKVALPHPEGLRHEACLQADRIASLSDPQNRTVYHDYPHDSHFLEYVDDALNRLRNRTRAFRPSVRKKEIPVSAETFEHLKSQRRDLDIFDGISIKYRSARTRIAVPQQELFVR